MRRHIDPHQLSPSRPNNDKGVEQAKANGRDHEQIDGSAAWVMLRRATSFGLHTGKWRSE
jgi:hypothetical protein